MPSVKLNALDAAEWTAALKQANYSTLQQSWEYGAAMQMTGTQIIRAALYVDERLVGLAQLQHRKLGKLLPTCLCLRGPIWLENIATEMKSNLYLALRKSLPINRPRVLLFMPESNDQDALCKTKLRRVMTGHHTVLLDLTKPLEELRALMDGKWRNRLVAAEESKMKVNQTHDIHWLIETEAKQSESVGYLGLPPAFTRAWQIQAGERGMLCLTAMHKRETLAAVLCLIHGNSATYQIGWSSEEGKQLSAHNLLLWNAMKQLKAKGITTFDLGGMNTEDMAGIARFKIGTGGKVITLPGSYF